MKLLVVLFIIKLFVPKYFIQKSPNTFHLRIPFLTIRSLFITACVLRKNLLKISVPLFEYSHLPLEFSRSTTELPHHKLHSGQVHTLAFLRNGYWIP